MKNLTLQVIGVNTPDTNESVLAGMQAIRSKLVEHGEKIEAINAKLVSGGESGEPTDQQAQTSR